MKYSQEYNDLLLKSFIRESFYKYSKKSLFETKKKEVIDELDDIDKFLENLAEESLKLEESKRRKSIKFLLEDDTQIFNSDGSLYVPKPYQITDDPDDPETKKTFRAWAKNNKVKVFGTVLCAIMLNLVASTVGDGGINPNTKNQGNFNSGIELATNDLGPKDLELPEVPLETFNKLKKKAAEELKKSGNPFKAKKKIKKLRQKIKKQGTKKVVIKKPKAPTPEQAPAIQELEEQEEQVQQLESEVDKQMVELENKIKKGAKEYGDFSISKLKGKITDAEIKKVLKTSKRNVDKAEEFVNQNTETEDASLDDEDNETKKPILSEKQQKEVAYAMNNWIQSQIQSQILEGELGDDLRNATSENTEKGIVKLTQTQSAEGQIDKSIYEGDPLAVASERLSTLSLSINDLSDPDMEFDELLKDQLKDKSVSESILKAFEKAGLDSSKAKSKLDEIINNTANKGDKVLDAFIDAVKKGKKLRLRSVPKYNPLANPTIRSGTATDQSI